MSRNDRRSFLCVGIVALSVVLVGAPPAVGQCLGDTTGATCLCVDDASNPTICAKWTAAGEPLHPDDFSVDFACTGCSTEPDIVLKVGGTSSDPVTWTLWSFDDADPNDLGETGKPGTVTYKWQSCPRKQVTVPRFSRFSPASLRFPGLCSLSGYVYRRALSLQR